MKQLRSQNLIDSIEELKTKFSNNYLNTIELGTIRSTRDMQLGQSTICISRALGEKGSLISVDISSKSIKISKQICCAMNNITWVQSDSILYLKEELKDKKFHFAFLDTLNIASNTFKEFYLLIPAMLENSILTIDDAGITKDCNSIDTTIPAQKGHEVYRFLKSCGAEFSVIPYPNSIPGTQLKLVLHKNNLKLIKSNLLDLNRDES